MNGKLLVLNLVSKKRSIGFINLIVSEQPSFDYDKQPLMPEPFPGEVFSKEYQVSPTVYTGLVRPKHGWINFGTGQLLSVEQGEDCSDELFAMWVCECVKCQPLSLLVKEKGEKVFQFDLRTGE